MTHEPLRAELKTLRLTEPFRIAHGSSSERTVLRVRCGDAVGEAPFVPYYKEDPAETLQWLQDRTLNESTLLGLGPEAPRAARLACSLLWTELRCRQENLAMRDWLRRVSPCEHDGPPPPGCRSFSIPTDLDEFAEKVLMTSQRFSVLKLKLGSGNLDFDEAITARAIECAPKATIFADANGGWSPRDASKIIPRLARHGIVFIEQPIHHERGVEGWRELRSELLHHPVPIFADESLQDVTDLVKLTGLIDGVNIKLLKCGGEAETNATIIAAHSLGLQVLVGCMIESSIGVTAAAQFAHIADWIDLDGHLYVANDDYEGISYDECGNLVLPDRPGIGVVPKGKD